MLLILSLLAGMSHVFSSSPTQPVTIVISQKVEKRQPVGPSLDKVDRFKLLNNKLYAWTRLNKIIPGRIVHHVWYHQETLMDDIELPIGAQLGRMTSAKTIRMPCVGVWRVEVLSEDRKLLDSRYFSVDLIEGELHATVLERPRA